MAQSSGPPDDEVWLACRQLTRLACDVDQIAQKIAERRLTPAEARHLNPGALILHYALDAIQDALYRAGKLDQRPADWERKAA